MNGALTAFARTINLAWHSSVCLHCSVWPAFRPVEPLSEFLLITDLLYNVALLSGIVPSCT